MVQQLGAHNALPEVPRSLPGIPVGLLTTPAVEIKPIVLISTQQALHSGVNPV